MKHNYFVGAALLFLLTGISAGIAGISADKDATATLGGGLITASAFLFSVWQYLRETEDKRSEFFLKESIQGLAMAHKLLSDGKIDRVTWVLAGRILSRIRFITAQITNEAHRSVLEIHKDEYRNKFADALRIGQHDLAGHFYGVAAVHPGLDGAHAVVQELEDPAWIPETVLKAIHYFADEPNYLNTLKHDFVADDMHRLQVIFPSVYAYVLHLRKKQPMTKVSVRSVST